MKTTTTLVIIVLSMACGGILHDLIQSQNESIPTIGAMPSFAELNELNVWGQNTVKPGENHVWINDMWEPMVPHNYYVMQSINNLTDVHSYLASFNWTDNQQYERNVFDCSNMAAWMERHLECQGYNVQIRHTKTHAWIMVEVTPKNWQAYECTTCEWKPVDDPQFFIGENAEYYCGNILTYDNIYNIRDSYTNTSIGQYLFNREWM